MKYSVTTDSFAIQGPCQTLSASMKKKEKKEKPPCTTQVFFSSPQAQTSIDVFQLHSTSITETFAEIMIKALASCHFDLIRDILVSFFLCYQLSKLHIAEWSAFVHGSWYHLLPKSQLVQIMRTLGTILSKSTTSTFVLLTTFSKPLPGNEASYETAVMRPFIFCSSWNLILYFDCIPPILNNTYQESMQISDY